MLSLLAHAATDPGPAISIDAFYTWPSPVGTEPTGVSWSADGRRLAFLWNEAGFPFLDVYVAEVDRPGLTRVTRFPHVDPPADAGATWAEQRAAIAAEVDRGVRSVSWLPDGKRLLVSFKGELYLVTPGTEPVNVTVSPASEERPALSRSGRLAFLRDRDLYVAEPTRDGFAPPVRVTSLAGPRVGVERFGWSPDGTALWLITADRAHVRTRLVPDYLPEEVAVQEVPRPFPGEEAEHRALGVVGLDGGAPRWLELTQRPTDLFFTVEFSPGSDRLLVDTSDVLVKDRRLLVVDVKKDQPAVTVVREADPLNTSADWQAAWAPDGRSVYFTSDREWDTHVYRAANTDGARPTAITRGQWTVFDLTVTPRGVVVVGNPVKPEQRHVVRAPLGGGPASPCASRQGTFTPTVSPDGRWAAVLFSSDTTPPDLSLMNLATCAERRLTTSARPALLAISWAPARYVTFPASDGSTLHGRIQLPPGYREGQRYPVIVGSIYSGTVRNQWGGRNAHPLWGLDRVLLERGYVLFAVDVAGSAGHGRAFRRRIRHDYGGIDVDDIATGVRWLIEQGIADPPRVGIWGSSYGGLLTSMSLFTRPGLYRAGVAAAPATNVFHAMTGEQRVMDRPQEETAAYTEASPFTRAAGLEDPLMIIHGMRDVIVLYRDSVWLTQHLIQMGKDVELVTLPDAPHGWDLGPHGQTRYAFKRMIDFFDRHLAPAGR